MAREHLILVGPMGVGKTTVGHELARMLGRGFLDSDAELTRDHGVDGATIAQRDGVAALHGVELATLVRMTSTTEPCVIAAAASVVDTAEGRGVLGDHVTVWLDADPDALATRRRAGDHRRSIDDAEAERLRRRRRPHLASVASIRVDTTEGPPDQVALRILAALAGA